MAAQFTRLESLEHRYGIVSEPLVSQPLCVSDANNPFHPQPKPNVQLTPPPSESELKLEQNPKEFITSPKKLMNINNSVGEGNHAAAPLTLSAPPPHYPHPLV